MTAQPHRDQDDGPHQHQAEDDDRAQSGRRRLPTTGASIVFRTLTTRWADEHGPTPVCRDVADDHRRRCSVPARSSPLGSSSGPRRTSGGLASHPRCADSAREFPPRRKPSFSTTRRLAAFSGRMLTSMRCSPTGPRAVIDGQRDRGRHHAATGEPLIHPVADVAESIEPRTIPATLSWPANSPSTSITNGSARPARASARSRRVIVVKTAARHPEHAGTGRRGRLPRPQPLDVAAPRLHPGGASRIRSGRSATAPSRQHRRPARHASVTATSARSTCTHGCRRSSIITADRRTRLDGGRSPPVRR